jgi:hypothetical protein
MKKTVVLLGIGLIGGFGFAIPTLADDHLYEALEHGLKAGSPGDIHGDKAPGQGSPFTTQGELAIGKIPSTDTPVANTKGQTLPSAAIDHAHR